MEKTRHLSKKSRDTKAIFHAKMNTIKDRNGMGLTEAEEIIQKQQEYTEELHKNGFNEPENQNGVITHLETDILECEVNWASGSITTDKARGSGGIQAELFKILEDDAVKLLHSICHQIWKTHRTGKGLFIPIAKGAMPKKCSNYCAIALISHANKVILKIL